MYFLLWVVIKEKWKILVWTVHSFQTNVPKVLIWSCGSLLKSLWWLSIADPRKGPLSLWVPQPLWFGLSLFLVSLLLLVFTSSDQEWAVMCSWIYSGLSIPLNLCPSACPRLSERYPHVDLTSVNLRFSVCCKGSGLESHPTRDWLRFCHLLCGQVI